MFPLIIIFISVISLKSHSAVYTNNIQLSANCIYQVDKQVALQFPKMILGENLSSVLFEPRASIDNDGKFLISLSRNGIAENSYAVSLTRLDRNNGKPNVKGKTSDLILVDSSKLSELESKDLRMEYKFKKKNIKVRCNFNDSPLL